MDVDAAINKLRVLGLQPTRIVIEPFELSPRDRTDFSCGETALDDYIKTRVSQDLRQGICWSWDIIPSTPTQSP